MVIGCETGANVTTMRKLLKAYPHLLNVRCFYAEGVSVSPLEFAASNGQTAAVKFLYNNYQQQIDASPTVVTLLGKSVTTSQPMKALLSATQKGHADIIRYLVPKIGKFSAEDKRQIAGAMFLNGRDDVARLYGDLGFFKSSDLEVFKKRKVHPTTPFWHPPMVAPNVTAVTHATTNARRDRFNRPG